MKELKPVLIVSALWMLVVVVGLVIYVYGEKVPKVGKPLSAISIKEGGSVKLVGGNPFADDPLVEKKKTPSDKVFTEEESIEETVKNAVYGVKRVDKSFDKGSYPRNNWTIEETNQYLEDRMSKAFIRYLPDVLSDPLEFSADVSFELYYPFGNELVLNSILTQLADYLDCSIKEFNLYLLDDYTEDWPYYIVIRGDRFYKVYFWDDAGWLE